MFRESTALIVIFLTSALMPAQQPSATAAPSASNPLPPGDTAYYDGPNVSAPELIPLSLETIGAGHCDKLDGVATLTAIVDAQGVPVQIVFLRSAGNGVDKMAAHMVSLDRFKPGMRDGSPVPTVISDEIKVQTCIERSKNDAGKKVITLHLRSVPDQRINLMKSPGAEATVSFIDRPPEDAPVAAFKAGSGVTPPVVIHSVGADFSPDARLRHISGVCLISLIVDTHGLPQNLRVARSLEPSLDQNALVAISHYRFKPAMKNGVPVPAVITIEVDFTQSGPPF